MRNIFNNDCSIGLAFLNHIRKAAFYPLSKDNLNGLNRTREAYK